MMSCQKGNRFLEPKSGYGSMVLLSLEQYEELTNDVELALDEANRAAALSDTRYYADEVFGREHQSPYYHIQIRNFTNFYVVKGDVMEIRGILCHRRNWKNTFRIARPEYPLWRKPHSSCRSSQKTAGSTLL